MGRERRVISTSEAKTRQFGKELVQLFPDGAIFCFKGDLGAGKTTLVKGIVEGATTCDPNSVTSPTYTYLNIYDTVYHFDLYRLSGLDDFYEMGFEEYFDQPGYLCIEWSERIAEILPENHCMIEMNAIDATTREIVWKLPVTTPAT